MRSLLILVVMASDKIAFPNVHKEEYDSLCETDEKGKLIPVELEYTKVESELIEVYTTSKKKDDQILSAVKSNYERSGKNVVRIEKVDQPKKSKAKKEKENPSPDDSPNVGEEDEE